MWQRSPHPALEFNTLIQEKKPYLHREVLNDLEQNISTKCEMQMLIDNKMWKLMKISEN